MDADVAKASAQTNYTINSASGKLPSSDVDICHKNSFDKWVAELHLQHGHGTLSIVNIHCRLWELDA
jgi:hypothetical protein